MKKFFLVFFLLIISQTHNAQIRELGKNTKKGIDSKGLRQYNNQNDTLNKREIKVKLDGKTKYTDYKIISHTYDTTYVDTTLTIKKDYIFNFRRKDNFELLPFHNQGQTFNNLAYSFSQPKLFPDIGFNAKQFNYINIDEVNYYRVPTPTSQVMYRTGQEQGQVLDVLFTLNFSKRLNVSLAYRGLRSLGQYRRSLASTGNFIGTFSYSTPEDQYNIRTHITSQNFTNQENGGLTSTSLQNFLSNNEEFTDRGRLDVNLADAENKLDGLRVYINHNYKLFSSKDSTNTKDFSNLKVGHIFTYENKKYVYSENTPTTSLFGNTSRNSAIKDSLNYRLVNNQAYLEFNSKYVLGKFKVKANYTTTNYGYDSIININNPVNKIKLKGNAISFGADWKGKINNFEINADATIVPGSGHLAGSYFNGTALYKKDSVFTAKGTLSLTSKAPNFNYTLHQSSYNDYNWNTDYSNTTTQNIGFAFLSKWGNALLDFTSIQDYTYFDENSKPQQFDDIVTYLKVKVNKEFKYGKFALDNTVMYQNVSNGSSVFRVPQLVTRNTFYYADEWFKGKPLLVNIGMTFNYFTKYKANAYNPLLAEFTLQNNTEIGYPTLDVFFNARVRRTRIYFKIDNVTSSFTTKNYFSAPNHPYRDMSIRFGLVWNWFI